MEKVSTTTRVINYYHVLTYFAQSVRWKQAAKYVDCSQSFAKVVYSCYGNYLDRDYRPTFHILYKTSRSHSRTLVISVTPKVHRVLTSTISALL